MNETRFIDTEVADRQLISSEIAWSYRVIPKQSEEGLITLFIDENTDSPDVREEVQMLFDKKVVFQPQPRDTIQNTLSSIYRKTAGVTKTAKLDSANADRFLEDLIIESKDIGSSDIHIEVYDESARVRMRIDGLLVERFTLDKTRYPALVNRIKIKANLDIAEKRLPQDGRINFNEDGLRVDIRVSILPSLYGEKVVMRLLSRDTTNVDIDSLGMRKNERDIYLESIKNTSGILLISGPTGSGKTTTLYATLKLLNETKRNILTIEDPIEYTLDGINQVQLKDSIGLTFAKALRTFLRQDPDVIMVGEIRDSETAEMAIRAALTGHLVLSTIHTNSALETINRLIDMGVPDYLVANTLKLSVAQRLLRKLCSHCKKEKSLNSADFPSWVEQKNIPERHYVPQGCEHCHFTGYSGRTAVYEMINMNQELVKSIKTGSLNSTEYQKNQDIKSLGANALELFEQGITSLEEIYPILLTSKN
ncbi:GspE/PulE family protein [Halocola ammonii]